MSRTKAEPCKRCGTACHGKTGLCGDCYRLIPARERTGTYGQFQLRPTHLKTGTTVNVTPPDDLQNSTENIRPGSNFENSPREIASVKQHIDERAIDQADKADLTRTIFGRGK